MKSWSSQIKPHCTLTNLASLVLGLGFLIFVLALNRGMLMVSDFMQYANAVYRFAHPMPELNSFVTDSEWAWFDRLSFAYIIEIFRRFMDFQYICATLLGLTVGLWMIKFTHEREVFAAW